MPDDVLKENISIKYLKQSANQLGDLKKLTYALIQQQNPKKVLDAGCGPGIDTLELGKLLPDEALITGIDNDPEMIKAADDTIMQQNLQKKVKHLLAGIEKLSFSDDYFDAVRAERLFQVISEKSIPSLNIFNELYRVLKPGGLMVLADTDWATASVDFSDYKTERELLQFFTEKLRPNGISARTFYRLMKDKNMLRVETCIFPIVMKTFDSNHPLADWLYTEAVKAEPVQKEKLGLWMRELKEKSAADKFFSVTNMIVVSGLKPQS